MAIRKLGNREIGELGNLAKVAKAGAGGRMRADGRAVTGHPPGGGAVTRQAVMALAHHNQEFTTGAENCSFLRNGKHTFLRFFSKFL